MERNLTLTNSTKILCFSFNQNNSCFCIGTEKGFIIYKSSPLNDYYIRNLEGGIGHIAMFNNSNILGLVGGGKRPFSSLNKLVIYNDATSKVVFEITVDFKIKLVKVKNSLIVISGKNSIKVYYYDSLENIMNYQEIDSIPVPESKNNLLSINLDPVQNILAYLTKNTGEIIIKTYPSKNNENNNIISRAKTSINPIKKISAHQTEITVMALNHKGDLIASCSQKGSIIKLFSTITGNLLKELRRGTDSAEIYSLNFNKTSQYVLCSSSKGTIHIFNVKKNKEVKNPKSFLSSIAPLINMQNSILDNEWSFAQYHIDCKRNNIANFYGDDNSIIVLTEEGMYYRASLNVKGGECTTLQSKSFLEMDNKDDDFYYDE